MSLPKFAAGLLFAATVAAPSLAPVPARAQMESREAITLQNQIAELRQELQIMQQTQQSGGGVPSSLAPPEPQQPQGPPPGAGTGDVAADLVVRVATLEEQNRTLQGRVDDLTNQVQRMNDALTKQIGDLAFKLGQGAGGDTSGSADGAPAPQPGQDPMPLIAPLTPNNPTPKGPPQAHRTPEMALRDGNAALARRDYATAAAMAREALAGHGPRATDAQFLLARAEGGQHQYREAAADFYLAYNHAPKSATAPVALLGVANALIALDDRKDACEALGKLSAEFPRVGAGMRASLAGARKRAACSR